MSYDFPPPALPDDYPLVAPEASRHPLYYLGIGLMLVIGIGGPMVSLVALALPLFLR